MRRTLVTVYVLALLVVGGAQIPRAQPKGERATIKGEIVDLWCYLEGGDRGAGEERLCHRVFQGRQPDRCARLQGKSVRNRRPERSPARPDAASGQDEPGSHRYWDAHQERRRADDYRCGEMSQFIRGGSSSLGSETH